MSQYRKKPLIIDAYQIPPNDDQTRELPPPWVLDAIANGLFWERGGVWAVKTSENNTQLVNVGDWLIKGVDELYGCTDSVFQATYEKV